MFKITQVKDVFEQELILEMSFTDFNKLKKEINCRLKNTELLKVECFKIKTYNVESKDGVYRYKHLYNKRTIKLLEIKKIKSFEMVENGEKEVNILSNAYLLWQNAKKYTLTISREECERRKVLYMDMLKAQL